MENYYERYCELIKAKEILAESLDINLMFAYPKTNEELHEVCKITQDVIGINNVGISLSNYRGGPSMSLILSTDAYEMYISLRTKLLPESFFKVKDVLLYGKPETITNKHVIKEYSISSMTREDDFTYYRMEHCYRSKNITNELFNKILNEYAKE